MILIFHGNFNLSSFTIPTLATEKPVQDKITGRLKELDLYFVELDRTPNPPDLSEWGAEDQELQREDKKVAAEGQAYRC